MDNIAFSSNPNRFTLNRNIATDVVSNAAGSSFNQLMPFVATIQMGKARNERQLISRNDLPAAKTKEDRDINNQKIFDLLNTEKMWAFIARDADSYLSAENQISMLSRGLSEEEGDQVNESIPAESDEQIVESLVKMYAASEEASEKYFNERPLAMQIPGILNTDSNVASNMRKEINKNSTVRNAILEKGETELEALQASAAEYFEIKPRSKSIFDALATEVKVNDLLMRGEQSIKLTGFAGSKERTAIQRRIESELQNSNAKSLIGVSVKRNAKVMLKRLEMANRQFRRELSR